MQIIDYLLSELWNCVLLGDPWEILFFLHRSFFFLLFPFAFEAAIIEKELLKGHRFEVVDVDSGVEDVVICRNQRPEIHLSVLVDVAMNHIGSLGVLPGKQRVMAQGDSSLSSGQLLHKRNALEMLSEIDLVHP